MVNLSFNSDFFFSRNIQIILGAASIAIAISIAAFGYLLFASTAISLFYLHVFVAIGVIIGLIAPAIILIFKERRKNQIDQHLPVVLEDIAEGLRAGLTFIESIEEVSKRDYGWISKELKTIAAQISWGVSLDEAFKGFARRVGTDMAKKTTTLLLAGIRLGGELRTIFRSTASFLREMLDAKEDRDEQLKPYLSIIYVTLVVFIVTMVMLYKSLSSLFEIDSQILKIQLQQSDLKVLLFDLAILEGIFGGLIASKLSGGSIYPGLKHSIAMLIINTVSFILFF